MGYKSVTDPAIYSGGDFKPPAANVYDLGSVTEEWDDAYFGDDGGVYLGSDQDGGIYHRSTTLAADTALTGVIEGTPDTLALPANSIVLFNVTNDGDAAIVVSKAGNTHTAFQADASAGDTILNAASGASVDTYIAGSKQIDYATGAMAFQQATQISTAANGLNLNPATIVGINVTADANVTTGLSINQGAETDSLLSFKASFVTHALEDIMETNSYANFSAAASTEGGLSIVSVVESGNGTPFKITAYGGNPGTTKSTSGRSGMELNLLQHNGSNALANLQADGNVVGFRARRSGALATIAIFDEDGDLHLDAGGGAGTADPTTDHASGIVGYNFYDEYDDWKMARALRASLAPVGHWVREKYAGIIEQYQPVLERSGMVTYNDDGHHFLAMKRMALFSLDAIFQLGERGMHQEERINELEESNAKLLKMLEAA